MSTFQVPVSLYMTTPVVTVNANASLGQAHARMEEHGISSLVVRDPDSGAMVGLISRDNLLRVGRMEAGTRPSDATLTLPDRPISAEMSHDVATVAPDAHLSAAAALMVRDRTHRVPVVVDGECVGIVTTRDLMRALEEKRGNHQVSEFMSHPVFTVRAEEPVSLAVERLERARVTGLVVVENDWPVGIFTQVEALESRDVPRNTAVEDVMSPRILALRPDTLLHRAAAQAAATRVRRVIVQDGDRLAGILTGLDFARAVS
ncbi:MAG: CBS domain-containing protein [Gemmatimonadales bacterium]|nr:MAG: CBS domain-containing protein [Gemmatimonadales bacterium]